MTSTNDDTYEVSVVFTPAGEGTFRYEGDVKYDELGLHPTISIPAGTRKTINYTLSTNSPSGAEATFPSDPVEWMSGSPCSPEKLASNSLKMVIDNNNNTTQKEKYGFKLKVVYGGPDDVYTSPDPTIINEPPVGTGYPDAPAQ